jgi:hypothetical protein
MNIFKRFFSNDRNASENISEILPEQEFKALCPYCENILEQFPKRKKKCSYCKQEIFVRTSPLTRCKVLVTEEGSKKIDIELKKISFRNRWIREIEGLGITEKDFYSRKETFFVKNGFEAKDGDVFWSLFNESITKTRDLHKSKGIYYLMSLFLHEEGRDYFATRQLSAKMELMQERNSSIKLKAKIIAAKDSCEVCQKLDGRIMSVEEALEKMPVPCKECTHTISDNKRGFCRCMYVLIAEEDEDGLPIRRE